VSQTTLTWAGITGFSPPLARTVKIPVYAPHQEWTPVSTLSWSLRNPSSQAWYWADFTDVLADESNAVIENLAVGLPDNDGALTVAHYTFVGPYVGFLPLGGTPGKSYTILLAPLLSSDQEVDAVSIILPVLSTAPIIAPPAGFVTFRGALLTIAGISFSVG
jgi:hypothetical protein